MLEPTDKDIEDARAEANGEKVYRFDGIVEDEEIHLIFKKPSKIETHRFLDQVKAAPTTAATVRAQENFALAWVVWPSKKEIKPLFDKHYGLATKISDEMLNKALSEVKASTQGL